MAMTGRTRGSAPAATDKKYRRGSSTSWSGKRGGPRGGAGGRGGFAKGQAVGSRDGSTRGRRGGLGAAARGGRVPKQSTEEEEEWQGIASSPEPAEEAEPEAASDEDEEEEVVAAAPPPKKKQRKPTGGTGKKQKVFVEGKSDLLALAASVSGDVAKKTQAKVEKAKSKPVKAAPQTDRREPSETKQKQLAAARAVVSARTKAKRESSRPAAAEPESLAPATASAKKGVRFA